MTRTMLNWSELVEKYRGKSIQNSPSLKKWSEMGKPDTTKKKTEIELESNGPKNLKERTSGTEAKALENQISVGFDHKPVVKTKIKDMDLGDSYVGYLDYEVLLPHKKISLAELLYDTLFQDTETIPALYGTDQKPSAEVKMYSERDTILLDLLEYNLNQNRI